MTDSPGDAAKPSEDANAPEPIAEENPVNQQSTSSSDVSTAPKRPAQSVQFVSRLWTKDIVLPLASIVVAGLTAFFSAYYTHETAVGSARFTHLQTVLNDRKTAYSDLVSKALASEDLQRRVATWKFEQPQPLTLEQNSPKIRDDLDKQESAREQLSIAAAAVDLLGSDTVRLRALDLRDAHNKVYDAYVKITSEWVKNPDNRQAIEAAINDYVSTWRETSDARNKFIDAARSDLGISFGPP